MNTQEIECRFLEIDKGALIKKLREIGAEDKGEVMLEETIVYHPEGKWKGFVRIRNKGDTTTLTYKEHRSHTVDGTYEIEVEVSDFNRIESILENIGFPPTRRQQKKRHSFVLDGVEIDFDTWPRIPTYVEIEGESEEKLKQTAHRLGLDWKDANTQNAATVIENIYNIPVRTLKHFTFDKFE